MVLVVIKILTGWVNYPGHVSRIAGQSATGAQLVNYHGHSNMN